MVRIDRRCAILTFVLVVAIGSIQIASGDDSLAKVMPAGASIYASASNLGAVVTRFEKSKLFDLLRSTPQWRAYLQSPDYERLNAGRKFVEAQLGQDAVEALKKLLGRDLAVGVYPKKNSKQSDVVVVLWSADPMLLEKARTQVENLSRLFGKGLLDSVGKTGDAWLWSVQGRVFFASKDDWIAIASTKELAQKSAALIQKPIGASLANDPQFIRAIKDILTSAQIKVFADLHLLAESSGNKRESVKFDNVVGAWLFGGVAEIARMAPFASASLSFGESGVSTNILAPVNWSALSPGMVGFFAKPGTAGATQFPPLPSTIAAFSFGRDFVHLYKARESNLQARILPEFDKFESGIANLMPGRSFSEDILPLLGRRLSILVGPQDFAGLSGEPALKLPGFAFVFEPGSSEQAGDLFQLLFQSIVAILNFQVGERGGEPMVIRAEVHNGVEISYGRHMKSNAKGPLPFAVNFTPASARVGDRLILSSSHDFCRQIVDAIKSGSGKVDKIIQPKNAVFFAKADAIADALVANRSFLESKIVQSGKSAAQAKSDFDLGLTILRLLHDLQASGQVREAGYQLHVNLTWK